METEEETLPKKAFPTWKDLLLILVVFLGANLLAGLLAGAATGTPLSGLRIFLVYTATFAVTIGFAFRLARRRMDRPVIRLTFRGFCPTQVLGGLILMLAMSVVIEPVVNLFPKEWYDLVGERIASGGWAMFTAVIAAPVCEEILFRGVIQQGLTRRLGAWGGILAASAVFGLIHGIPQQIVAGFCLGIIIGWVYRRTGSLLAAMVLHAINNALGVFMTLFQTEENADQTLRQTLGDDRMYTGVFAFCALLLIVSLLFAIFAKNHRAVGQSA